MLSDNKAQVCKNPTDTAVAVEIPDTVTGVVLFVVVSSPSCPDWLDPQHLIVLLVSRAQEWP